MICVIVLRCRASASLEKIKHGNEVVNSVSSCTEMVTMCATHVSREVCLDMSTRPHSYPHVDAYRTVSVLYPCVCACVRI